MTTTRDARQVEPRRRGLPNSNSDLLYLALCLLYPPWKLVLPVEDAHDPWWGWFAVSGVVLVAVVAAAMGARWGRACVQQRLFAFPIAAHLSWLVANNPQEPVYTVALLASIGVSGLAFHGHLPLVAYTGWIALLLLGTETGLAMGTSPRLAAAWFLFGAHLRYAAEAGLRGRATARIGALEQRVAERDRTLETTSAHLSEEARRRRQLEEELEVSHRMETAGRLAGALAHEFNNQLMTIRLYLDLLQPSLPSDETSRADYDTIVAATRRAEVLTSRLLSIGRGRHSGAPGSVSEVVEESVKLLEQVLGEDSRVDVSIAPGPTTVPLDADGIQQILLNLALNARDAMPEHGTLGVEVTRQLEHLSEDEHPHVVVCLLVCDTGVGIEPEVRRRIFDPYFTTKDDPERSGLGLSIVYSAVADSGGQIRVTSEPGDGACFEMRWPLVHPSEESVPSRPDPVAAPCSHKVLLVEDEAELRAGLRRWLLDAGFEVVEVASAEEALRRLETGERFDVLASDVVLTGASGIELVEELRRRELDLPALLFSGHTERRGRSESLPKGVPLLRKPFSARDLVDALAETLGGQPARHEIW